MDEEQFQSLLSALENRYNRYYNADESALTSFTRSVSEFIFGEEDDSIIAEADYNCLSDKQSEQIVGYFYMSNGMPDAVVTNEEFQKVMGDLHEDSYFMQEIATLLKETGHTQVLREYYGLDVEDVPEQEVTNNVDRVVSGNEEVRSAVKDLQTSVSRNYTAAKDTRRLDSDLAVITKAFPEIGSRSSKLGMNDIILLTHAVSENSRNILSEQNIADLNEVIEEGIRNGDPIEDIVYDVNKHAIMEGHENRAYGDTYGYRTIGVGTLLYDPDSKSAAKQREIKHQADIMGITLKEYRNVYNGKSVLSETQIKDLHNDHLTRNGGGIDNVNSVIEQALEGTNLNAHDIDPRLLVVMNTVVYQAPNAFSKILDRKMDQEYGYNNSENLLEAIRTAADPSKGWKEKKEAHLDVLDIYVENTLLKTHNENPMSYRNRLSFRGNMLKALSVNDHNIPIGLDDIVNDINTRLRDQSQYGEVHVILEGKLPKTEDGKRNINIADILRHEDLNIDEDTDLSLYYKIGDKVVKFDQKGTEGFTKTYVTLDEGKRNVEEGADLDVANLKNNSSFIR